MAAIDDGNGHWIFIVNLRKIYVFWMLFIFDGICFLKQHCKN